MACSGTVRALGWMGGRLFVAVAGGEGVQQRQRGGRMLAGYGHGIRSCLHYVTAVGRWIGVTGLTSGATACRHDVTVGVGFRVVGFQPGGRTSGAGNIRGRSIGSRPAFPVQFVR